jgi:hypothetical protein
MTTNLDHRLMPAHHPNTPTPATTTGEGVRDVALFESRRGGKRAWDELSEIDRLVLLEAVRQRRKYEAHKSKIYSELYGMRTNK